MSKKPDVPTTIEHLIAYERLSQEAEHYKQLASQAHRQADLSFDEQCIIERFMKTENKLAQLWQIRNWPEVMVWSTKDWQKNGAAKAIKNLRKRGLVLMPKRAEYQLHPDLYAKLKATKEILQT